MKRILPFVALILPLGILFAQNEGLDKYPVDNSEKGEFTARQVGFMAVFPGCETIDYTDKANLQKCLAQKINELLGEELADFAEVLDERNIKGASAKIQFANDKNGKIIQPLALDVRNPELNTTADHAFHNIPAKINRIKPAALEDGTPVNLVFQMPIKYEVTSDEVDEPQFEWNEMVIATLKDANNVYEVRMTKNDGFKVYEIQSDNEIFLGKYNFPYEVFQSEPYQTILLKAEGKFLITEGLLNEVYYKIYGLQSDATNVHVYKVIDNEETLYETISIKDFYIL